MEVNEQAYAMPAKTHIRQQLSFVNRINGFDTLDFDDHQILDQRVYAITELNFFSFIDDWKPDMGRNAKACFSQLVSEASLVSTFQEPWAEL